MASVYYNDNDPRVCAWLRALIAAQVIAAGDVDDRSIEAIQPSDLVGYTRCHFFAGIGGWEYALQLAGWPDDQPVWTGSCPCQPFSQAGKLQKEKDSRHLWPEFRRLIAECRPPTVFGEQVASKAGREWLATVRTDLENVGYAVGAADLCAAGISAPHIRQRLWFVADAQYANRRAFRLHREDERDGTDARWTEAHRVVGACSEVHELADADRERRTRINSLLRAETERWNTPTIFEIAGGDEVGELGYPDNARPQGRSERGNGSDQRTARSSSVVDGGLDDANRERKASKRGLSGRAISQCFGGIWAEAGWLYCRDDKWRPVEPGTFPLAHGVPARMGRLRGYGNAIVPQVAAAFIEACHDVIVRE